MAVPQKNLALVLASLSTLVQNSVFKLQKGARHRNFLYDKLIFQLFGIKIKQFEM